MTRHTALLAACGFTLLTTLAHGQSLRERLEQAREDLREAATEAKQDAESETNALATKVEEASSAAATPSASTAPQPAVASGAAIDVEPFIRDATAIGNECRGLADTNQLKAGCLKQCDDTVSILSRARGQALPPGADAQAREAVRVCGVMRDLAKNQGNASP